MEFGNVYEVFELGDLVKINNWDILKKSVTPQKP